MTIASTPAVSHTRHGVFVLEKTDRSTADVIVAIDGQPVKTADLKPHRIQGDRQQVTLTALRDGHEIGLAVTLARGE